MTGGMWIDPKELPLPLREQVAVKVVAQLAQATPVAGQKEKRPLKVPVKRLCFTSPRAAARYEILRDAVREGIISELDVVTYDGCVIAFTYRVTWAGEFIPSGLPFRDLTAWRGLAKGTKVVEHIKKERVADAQKKIP